MSYAELYAHCQTLTPHINRNEVRDKLLSLTKLPKLPVMKTGLDTSVCRGFYLSAKNTDHRLVQQHGGTVIVVARDLNRCWSRFVIVKEMMHVFDDPLEATDTGDKFDNVLSELPLPTAPEMSPQMRSEYRCFWMALGLLCPEPSRLHFLQQRNEATTPEKQDNYAIALALRIPEAYVPTLFHPRYPDMIKSFCK